MTASQQSTNDKQTISNGEKVDSVSKLVDDVTALDSKVDFWNSLILVLMVVAALAATALVTAQWRAFRRAKELSSMRGRLLELKEQQFRKELADKDAQLRRELHEKDVLLAEELRAKDLKIAEANKVSAEANERAARANKSAGRAIEKAATANERAASADERAEEARNKNLETETRLENERMARLLLVDSLRPRGLGAVIGITIPLLNGFAQPYEIEMIGQDREVERFALQLRNMLSGSGWKLLETRIVPSAFPGVEVTGPMFSGMEPSAKAVVEYLEANNVDAKWNSSVIGNPPPPRDRVIITIGEKPRSEIVDVDFMAEILGEDNRQNIIKREQEKSEKRERLKKKWGVPPYGYDDENDSLKPPPSP